MFDKRLSPSGSPPRIKATLAGAAVLLIFTIAGASMIGDDPTPSPTPTTPAPARTDAAPDGHEATLRALAAAADDMELAEGADASAADTTGESLEGDVTPAKSTAAPREPRMRLPRAKTPLNAGRLITSFAVVLFLGVVGVFVGRIFLKRTRMATQGEKVLRIVDALPLGPKKQIYVVEVQGRRLVVGAGPESITLLSEFNDEELDERLALADSTPQESMRPAAGMPPLEELVR